MLATTEHSNATEAPDTHQQDSAGCVPRLPRRIGHACRFRPTRSSLGGAVDRLLQPLQLAVQLTGAA